ncbi:MAG: glycosyltransferase [bacterium]|jgi:glycosyltransferase involved in cell wall biosynthesis
MRVVHLITTLAIGGAEQMLVKLLRAMDRSEFEPTVVTLVTDGALIEVIRDMGIEVRSLDLRRGEVSPRALRRLITILRATRPDIVQSWMYHANVAASMARPWLPRKTGVAWNIRQSLYDISKERFLTQAVIRSGRVLAPHVDALVNNSHVSREQHAQIGYLNTRSLVIPNGFEIDSFRPDAAARTSFRSELAVDDHAVLVGIVARVHPSKDHANFFRAAEIAAARDPRLVFVCAGRGTDTHSRCREALRGPLRGRLRLLGERVDVPRVMAGLDILVSSSNTEGCPNAVGEGMACGLPVIGTDIGDTRDVIGDAGRIVPCGDAARLAAEVESLAAMGHARRREVGDAARERIESLYSIDSVASRYGRLYHEIVSERRGKGERAPRVRLPVATSAEPAI